jgi:hypothetical protein
MFMEPFWNHWPSRCNWNRLGLQSSDRKGDEMGQSYFVAVLNRWARWAKAIPPARLSQADWSAVDRLIEAAGPTLLEDSKALRELLARSKDQLKFTDPLLCNLGLHRWLAKDREESYSDWLAWTLEQLGDAQAVLRILGVEDAEFQSLCSGGTFVVEREAFVQEGSPDHEGKIDLLVHFGEPEQALLGVEVKASRLRRRMRATTNKKGI